MSGNGSNGGTPPGPRPGRGPSLPGALGEAVAASRAQGAVTGNGHELPATPPPTTKAGKAKLIAAGKLLRIVERNRDGSPWYARALRITNWRVLTQAFFLG